MALLPRLHALAEKWAGPCRTANTTAMNGDSGGGGGGGVSTGGGRCQFACVYILEAHACDEWPVQMADRDVPQHKSLNDRLSAARAFYDEGHLTSPHLPLFADDSNNTFNATYASWPFRFWVILPPDHSPQHGLKKKNAGRSNVKQALKARIAVKAMPKDASYDLNELEVWLEKYFATSRT